MMDCRLCNACDDPRSIDDAVERTSVPSNVRRFQHERFTVWRCANCGTLHSLEDIDYARYYQDYPLQRQKLDFFGRRIFASRLKQLVRGGLRPGHSILDYGCGNGSFVEYLRRKGHSKAEGYDPFSKGYSDRAVLARQFDVVLSQDVLEHVPDPLRGLDDLLRLVNPRNGMAVIGTPDAARLDPRDTLDVAGRLHQPYHRHLLTCAHLTRLVEARGFRVERVVSRWYLDTVFPFLNSNFLFRYCVSTGGVMDAMFESIRFSLVVSSPRLLYYGFLGGFSNPRKDVLVFARAQ